MDIYEFKEKLGMPYWQDLNDNQDALPCFCHRYTVPDAVKTAILIKQYIRVASEDSENDVIVFSVTEKDKCWKVWEAYAKAHPRTFKVVQGGSGHGPYQCRMYIYTKPKSKRKYG